jgi:hypothetical protein
VKRDTSEKFFVDFSQINDRTIFYFIVIFPTDTKFKINKNKSRGRRLRKWSLRKPEEITAQALKWILRVSDYIRALVNFCPYELELKKIML